MPDPPRSDGAGRRELYSNTMASWTLTQASLVASVISLPALTRLLSGAEFGLWSQLLSLNAVSVVADFGMAAVFLRALSADPGARATVSRAMRRYYAAVSVALTVVLGGICYVPGGILTPFLGHTQHPEPAAALMLAAIVTNLVVQPYALTLLARGRLDIERLFGAGPAVVGAFSTVAAAAVSHSALATCAAYLVTQTIFNVGLLLVARRGRPAGRPSGGGRLPRSTWRAWLGESGAVLAVTLTPQAVVAVDLVVVAHVGGPGLAAVFAVAARGGDLVSRLFMPLADSLFVTLCRSLAAQRRHLLRLAQRLSWLVAVCGLALGCGLVLLGPGPLAGLFGPHYGDVLAPMAVLVAVSTVRGMYMPQVRALQAQGRLGRLPYWFVAGLLAQAGLAVVLTSPRSVFGTAVAAFLAVVAFESVPVAVIARRSVPSTGLVRAVIVAIAGSGALIGLAAWRTGSGGSGAAVGAGAGAAVLAVAGLRQAIAYLRSVRSLVLDGPLPAGDLPG